MSYPKATRRTVVFVVLVLVALGVGYFLLKPDPQKENTNTATQPAVNEQVDAEAVQAEKIETADFAYDKPDGWAKLAKELLDSQGAVSGIATAPTPTTTFTVALEPASSAPSNAADLKNTTIATLQKLQNFELSNNDNVTIDDHSSQNFIYTFGDQTKQKQQLIIVIHKDNLFLLKFASTTTDFDAQTADFDKILSSFKLK